MIRFWSIAKNTFLQAIRQPIYAILIVLTFAILVFVDMPLSLWAIGTLSRGYHDTNQVMLATLGVGMLLMAGLAVAVFTASSVLGREVENRTALTVISKPVSRSMFVLAKFAGVAAAVALAYYLCTLVLLMTIRHEVLSSVQDPVDWPVVIFGFAALIAAILVAGLGNLWFGWSFISAGVWATTLLLTVAMLAIGFIGKGWVIVPFGQGIPPRLLPAIALTFLPVLILVAVNVASSTRVGLIGSILIGLAVVALGTWYDRLFSEPMHLVESGLLRWVIPRLTFFYVLNALVMDRPIPLDYVGMTALYSLAYVAGVLAIGVALFQRRRLEASTSGSLPGPIGLIAWLGRFAALGVGLIAVEALLRGGATALAGLLGAFRATGVADALRGMLDTAPHPEPGVWLWWLLAIPIAPLLWMFFGHFARGRRWTQIVLLAAVGLVIVHAAGVLLGLMPEAMVLGEAPAARSAAGGELLLGILLLGCLLLPSSRHHFRSERR